MEKKIIVKTFLIWGKTQSELPMTTVLHESHWRISSWSIHFVVLSFPHLEKKDLSRSVILNCVLNCIRVQFSSVKSFRLNSLCPTLCNPMNCSMPGLPVHHQLLEFTQIHVHWIGDAIQPSHPLLSPFPPALNLSQHQGLFKWVSSLHKVAKVLEFQLQHQSFQWTPRTDLL